jgi:hypothetical protein
VPLIAVAVKSGGTVSATVTKPVVGKSPPLPVMIR